MKLLTLFLTSLLSIGMLRASGADETPHRTNSALEQAAANRSDTSAKQQDSLNDSNESLKKPDVQSTPTSQSEAFNPAASIPLRTRLAHIIKGTAKIAASAGCLVTTYLLYKALVPDAEEINPLLDTPPAHPKKKNVDGWWDIIEKKLENNIETSTVQAAFILIFAGPSTLWAAYRLGHSAYSSFKTAFSGTPIKKPAPGQPKKAVDAPQTDDSSPEGKVETNGEKIQPKQAPSNEPPKRRYFL